VTLTNSTQDHVTEQVLWLGDLLSNRGMPRLLLEMHLAVLYRRLIRVAPDKLAAFEKLSEAAGELRRSRTRVISERELEALSKEFTVRLDCESNRLARHTGVLIAAAVADEKAGVKYAVPRLEDWLTDPIRFEEIDSLPPYLQRYRAALTEIGTLRCRWEGAVRETVQIARDIRK
jgi:hypothetical protein